MRRPTAAVLIPALAFTLALPTHAQTVACHLTYGGETRGVEATPGNAPYAGEPTAIGSFFLFRIVFVREPADLARINLYTHADLGEAPIPIQHASHPYPVGNQGRYGFTGLQRIYEPKRESELQYWCELKEAPGR